METALLWTVRILLLKAQRNFIFSTAVLFCGGWVRGGVLDLGRRGSLSPSVNYLRLTDFQVADECISNRPETGMT